jgi:long-chain fatty acid transport protein
MTRSLAFACAAVALCAAAAPLEGQGSSLDQHSACMSGRVGAGIAAPCVDGSAVYFSPAGLAMQPSVLGLNLTVIRSSNTFTYDAPLADPVVERDPETVLVPAGFINWRASDRVSVGIGGFAPFGLGLKWPVCSADDTSAQACAGQVNFQGRFTGYDNALRSFYVQPTVAFQLVPGTLSVGVGVDYVIGTIDVSQRVAGPANLGLGATDIADAHLTGDGSGWTGHVGALLTLSERASFGVRYLHSAKVDLEGDADFTQILTNVPFVDALITPQTQGNGPLADQSVATEIELPWQLVAGVAVQPLTGLQVMFDWQRTGWSSFDVFELQFGGGRLDSLNLGYKDANTFRLAAEFAATEKVALRAGFRYNEEATPRATPLLPEYERNYYTVGLGYRATPRLGADFSFQYIRQPDRRGALFPDGPLQGVYSSDGLTFGVTLSYQFGGGGTDGGRM